MNRKGQLGVGLLLTLAISVIVGLVLLQAAATNVEQGTRANTGAVTAANTSITAVQNVKYELTGQELVSTISVINASNNVVVPAANYTIAECVKTSDGLKGICYTGLGAYNSEGTGGAGAVKVSYTYYPNGYIDDSGSRSIFSLVILLAALAIAAAVLIPVANGIKDFG